MNRYVSFDIADQSFTFYTLAEWEGMLAEYRLELREMGYSIEDINEMETYEVLELIHGDELFWTEIQ